MALINVGGRDYGLATAGNCFVAMNTPGTAIVGHAAAITYDHTKALLHVFNGGESVICPVQLRLRLTNAGANGLGVRFEQEIDKGPSRWASGGTEITPAGTNLNGPISKANIHFGAATLAAASGSARTVGDANVRAVIGVVGDTYTFHWGSPAAGPMLNVTSLGTGVINVGYNYPAITINPNENFSVFQWVVDQSTGYQFEFQFDYLEG
jgi:hypothetical protein